MQKNSKHTDFINPFTRLKSVSAGVAIAAMPLILSAQAVEAKSKYSYSLYGSPGLMDMPTAESAEDGELAFTISTFKGQARTTLTFQVTPRISASFRYATINNHLPNGDRTWDRSFDFRYLIVKEGRIRPAIAVGLQDFMGTGLFSSEYIVATKHIGDRLTVTGGLGWGRLGTYNGFSNPLGALGSGFKTRPPRSPGLGGEPEFKRWFRGDAAFFGGIAWAVNDRLTFKAEYSSDAYLSETTSGLASERLRHRSPLNFGINYRVRPGVDFTAAYLYGSEIAVGLNIVFNPRHKASGAGLDSAPIPVKARPARHISPKDWGTGWINNPGRKTAIRTTLATVLKAEGMVLEAFHLTGNTARVRIRNNRYEATAQAIGRTSRILTQILPASVETFRIEPVVNGMAPTAVTLRRSDIEQLENVVGGAQLTYNRAKIEAVLPSDKMDYETDLYPKLSWGLSPYFATSFFDPDQPIRIQFGAELYAKYDITPGLSISGLIQQPLLGELGSNRASNSVLPHVRTDANIYGQARGPLLNRLTADYYFRPGRNLYGRVSAGYLERMYGGISTEILWKPVNSRLGLGMELNYVKKRDFDQRFGFQNYSVVTGHASAYYAFGNGFHGQLDVGRYLAGDWGATVSLDREFDNGWRVGAFATFTNVSAADFGEGSFDKGIRLTIPVAWVLGKPSPRKRTTTIRSLTRDGGARLNVEGRLYEVVRDFQNPTLNNRWGRFWK